MLTYHQRISDGVCGLGLSVLGTSAQATLFATAASLHTGEPVSIVGHGDRPTQKFACSGLIGPGTAVLEYRTAPDPSDLVVVAAEAVVEVLALYERHATRARQAVLIPGGAGGSLRATRMSVAAGNDEVTVTEASGFPFLGQVAGDTATFKARKDRLPIGGADTGATAQVVQWLRRYVPGVEAVDVLVTSLANMNHVIHPAIALANLARIGRGETFRFYREGIDGATMRLVSAVDRERRLLTSQLGQPDQSAEDWFDRFYSEQGFAGQDLFAGLATFTPFDASLGPTTTDHRYLIDDVRYGIAVYESLGASLDIDTPVISAVVTALSAATGHDLRNAASALAALLLDHHGTRPVPGMATATEPVATRRQ